MLSADASLGRIEQAVGLAGRVVAWLLSLDFDTLTRVARVTTPKLFIHSRADGVVPFAMAEALWNAAPTPKQHLWLEGIGHDETFYRARSQATLAMRAFLSSL